MNTYTIKYYAGTYEGTRTVQAEDGEEAIDKVKAWIRREMTIPMYSMGCSIISSHECNCDDE